MDDGLSGFYGAKPNGASRRIRPSLQWITELVENGEVDVLAIYKQNRLFRNHHNLAEFI